jgi:preprotein translocase subunit SecA
MVRFGGERTKALLARVGADENMSIRLKFVSRSIESAQKQVEGNNFDMRKALLQYDDVINQQREYIYEKRNEILDSDSIHEIVLDTFKTYITNLVNNHIMPEGYLTEQDITDILEFSNENLLRNEILLNDIKNLESEQLIEFLYNRILNEYDNKLKDIPEEITKEFEKAIVLRVIDTHWMEHINTMANLREGIGLRSYGQVDPLRAYTSEGFELYDEMLDNIDKDATTYLIKSEIRQNVERKQVIKGEAVTDQNKVKKQSPKKSTKVGRNDLCPCGSGKKYKQCCGK